MQVPLKEKRESVADKDDPALYYISNQTRNTGMSDCTRKMALAWSTYDAYVYNFAKVQEPGAGYDFVEKVGLVQMHSSYKLQKDSKWQLQKLCCFQVAWHERYGNGYERHDEQ